jgi:hypothetical protein
MNHHHPVITEVPSCPHGEKRDKERTPFPVHMGRKETKKEEKEIFQQIVSYAGGG